MPSCSLLGFLAGWLCTVVFLAVRDSVKIELARLATSIITSLPTTAFPVCVSFSTVFAIINIVVLDVVVLLPRLRKSLKYVPKAKQHIHKSLRFRSQNLAEVLAIRCHLAFSLRHKNGKARVPEQVQEQVDSIPGAYGNGPDSMAMALVLALIGLCACVVPLFIGWHSIDFIAFFVKTSTRPNVKADDDSLSGDDIDTTLVDENGTELEFVSSGKEDTKSAHPAPAAVLPSTLVWLSVSLSAPVISSTEDLGPIPASTSAPSFIPLGSLRQGPIPVPTVVAPTTATLNPLASAFVPTIRSTEVTSAVLASTATDRQKTEWEPAWPLSFRWARGGCATRITTPLAPQLNVSAAPFVPKARIDKSISGPFAVPAGPVKTSLAFRSSPPSFWSPGGCAIPIVPPSSSA
jgi:hypothetical protein